MSRPIRLTILWSATAIALLSLTTVLIALYFPVLARTDWDFCLLLLKAGMPIAYVLVWLMTGRTPLFWLAVGCLKAEAHQQQGWVIALEAVEEYQRRRPGMERKLRGEIGE